jgi:hypothetical protein
MPNDFNSEIPGVSSQWRFADYLGALRVRFSIGRNNYKINPGLYKLGDPDSKSDVFVTANYKLSFDILRKNLDGINAWILVLDTKGINVWCAAGKGTFGTGELIKQIGESNLHEIASHRRLILPQLGATGVSGYIVTKATQFNIRYGPIRATDIKKYIEAGYKTTDDMRKVRFNIMDRIILTPVEIVNSLWKVLLIIAIFFGISGIVSTGFSLQEALSQGSKAALFITAAYLSGAFLTPVLLPWLPGRYFAGKGIATAAAVFAIVVASGLAGSRTVYLTGWFLMSVALSSFLAMNFTGASTYTSLSGVKKEMRVFIPIQITAVLTGFILFIISKLI